MKNVLIIAIISLLTLSCSKSDVNKNNPYLPNYEFDTGNSINTNLPEFNDLKFTGNHIILSSNYGINGVVVYNFGNNNFSAFEITDPNHTIESCSILTVEGVIASCTCEDGNSYDVLTGQAREGTTGQYPLKRYFVEVSENIIRVYNN